MTAFDKAAFIAAVLAVTVGSMVLLALWFERRARRDGGTR